MKKVGKGRILIVDDDKAFRDTVADVLEAYGYFAVKASSGFAALEVIQANQFDIIITDVNMPDGNGIELLNAIRRTNPDLPNVIIITGLTDPADQELLGLGALEVFAKPFKTSRLIDCIEAALQNGKQSRQSNP